LKPVGKLDCQILQVFPFQKEQELTGMLSFSPILFCPVTNRIKRKHMQMLAILQHPLGYKKRKFLGVFGALS